MKLNVTIVSLKQTTNMKEKKKRREMLLGSALRGMVAIAHPS